MALKIKILAGILAALLLVGGVLYTNHLQHERDRLLLESATYREAADALAAEARANTDALAGREAERARLAAENEALTAKLGEVYANDPDAQAWADAPCPDAVLDCLLR